MSTFGGAVLEFPDIRVDYFRHIPERRPPLACFLSHVHSDHLNGLDILKSPFVYCSLATRELLLRLERYPHRLNFALGKLESRKLQYKHLKNLLKPIPLETPTVIELEPGNDIQVTLFDANHCIGAVMFLIEGKGKAVLYTGDIRSEPWFVNNLTRNPFLIEYTSGLKRLDCIYLDTSHTQPMEFPTKADGLKELLQKVSQYPPDTVFYISAWTFGYEEVWMALSRKLKCPIHVDNYKWKLYQSLRGDSNDKGIGSGSFHVSEGPVLAGYQCGNTPQVGCLTRDTSGRLHSCEKGMQCDAITDQTVWIRPIVTRSKHGVEVAEVGVGGGGGDLTQRPELEFDGDEIIGQLLASFASTENAALSDIKQMLFQSLRTNQKYISLDDMGLDGDQDDLDLSDLGAALARAVSEKRSKISMEDREEKPSGTILPNFITFPYARHSSYFELCHLVKVFNPKDIYPCTVDEQNWHEGASMKHLFGQHCFATTFRHDEEMRVLQSKRLSQVLSHQSQTTDSLRPSLTSPVQLAISSPAGTALSITSPPKMRTPPREILAMSPGSESQHLRRKGILQELTNERVKRVRLDFESNEYSPFPTNQQPNKKPGLIESRENVQSTMMDILIAARHNRYPEVNSPLNDKDSKNGEDLDVYWDQTDEVYRCGSCGHELWVSREECSDCCPAEEPAYFEVLDPNLGTIPGIVGGEDETSSNIDAEARLELLGDCLDFDSSAYDSQDERGENNDLYEIDSFIDDESIQDSQDENNDSSNDSSNDEEDEEDETDYKQKYFELQTDYFELADEFGECVDEYESFKRDMLGSDYDSFYDSDEPEMNENGVIMVDVTPPDPVLTEVVLSQSERQSQYQESETSDSLVDELLQATTEQESQKSEFLTEEENARAEAYEIALDRRWHDVSLVSTGANHSYEEAEL